MLPEIIIDYIFKFLSIDLYLEYYHPIIYENSKRINKEIIDYKFKYIDKKSLNYDLYLTQEGYDYIDNELSFWMNEKKHMRYWYTSKCINLTRRLIKFNPNISTTQNLDNYWSPPFNTTSEQRVKELVNVLTIPEMISLVTFFICKCAPWANHKQTIREPFLNKF